MVKNRDSNRTEILELRCRLHRRRYFKQFPISQTELDKLAIAWWNHMAIEILVIIVTVSGQWRDSCLFGAHNEVIKWKYFPRYWPFVQGIHRSSVNSPHKEQWREALMLSLICGWVKTRDAGDLRRHRAHYDVTAMQGSAWTTGISLGCFWKMYNFIHISRDSYS